MVFQLILSFIILLPLALLAHVVLTLSRTFVALIRWLILWQQLSLRKIARLHNEPTIRNFLDAGFAGDMAAKERYETKRVIAKEDIPLSVRIMIDSTIDHRFKIHFRTHKPTKTIKGFNDAKPGLEKFIYYSGTKRMREAQWSALTKFNTGINDLGKKLIVRCFPPEFAKDSLYEVDKGEMEARLSHELRIELNDLICKFVALEDFLLLHPCRLTDSEKQTIVYDSFTLWEIIDHRMIQMILRAEGELQDIFRQYLATHEERAQAIKMIMTNGFTDKNKRRVLEWFKSRRPQAATVEPLKVQPVADYPQARTKKVASGVLDPRKEIKEFVRTLKHLDKSKQNQIRYLTIQLDQETLLSISESIVELADYTGIDHDIFWELRYQELSSVEEEIENTPTRPVVKPTLLLVEPEGIFIEKVTSAKVIPYGYMTQLKQRINQGQITNPKDMRAALKLLVCFRLAHDGRSRPDKQGAYRIHRKSLIKKYLKFVDQSYAEGIIAELVREEKILSRKTGRTNPAPNDPVKLSPSELYRFKTA